MKIFKFKETFKAFFLHRYTIVGGILLLGLMLRLYQPLHVPFGFDQVQIAQAAQQIHEGAITLIGPRTGPASLFTGPFIYYLTAFIALFFSMHWAIVLTATSLSLLTGISLLYLSQKYLSPTYTAIFISIWAFSPFLISLDRVTWNPNLMILAASLAFFPLLKTKSLSYFDGFLLALGVFLGFQAHFSGLFLLPFVLIGICIRILQKLDLKGKSGFIMCMVGIGLLLTLTPTVIFDLRNDFLNLKGITSLSQNKDQVALYQSIQRIPNKVFIVFETIGKLLFYGNSVVLLFIAGIALFVGWLKAQKDILNHAVIISLSWLIAVIVLFSLYRESTPEYYFLLLIPVFIYMITSVLLHFLSNTQRIFFMSLLFLFGTFFSILQFQKSSGLDLATQLDTVSTIHKIHNKKTLSSLQFDMQPIEKIGLEYLLNTSGISFHDTQEKKTQKNNDSRILAIKYPIDTTVLTTHLIQNRVGLWIDSRVNPNETYLTTDNYVISAPKDISFYRATTHLFDFASKKYLLIHNGNQNTTTQSVIAELYVLDTKLDSDKQQALENKIKSSPLEILFKTPRFTFVSTEEAKELVRLIEPI